jgi:chromosomal replication initiation ATPase DnaA
MTESIVLQVCRECKVHPVEFFGNGRTQRLVRARRIAIFRLHQAGFNYRAISRLIRRNYSTVLYWVHAEYRRRHSAYFVRYNAARRAERPQNSVAA